MPGAGEHPRPQDTLSNLALHSEKSIFVKEDEKGKPRLSSWLGRNYFSEGSSGPKRKKTWNGMLKHLSDAKINLSVQQNFTSIKLFFIRLSGLGLGRCMLIYMS